MERLLPAICFSGSHPSFDTSVLSQANHTETGPITVDYDESRIPKLYYFWLILWIHDQESSYDFIAKRVSGLWFYSGATTLSYLGFDLEVMGVVF